MDESSAIIKMIERDCDYLRREFGIERGRYYDGCITDWVRDFGGAFTDLLYRSVDSDMPRLIVAMIRCAALLILWIESTLRNEDLRRVVENLTRAEYQDRRLV